MAKEIDDSNDLLFGTQSQVKELERLVASFSQRNRTASPVNETHHARQSTSGIKIAKFDIAKFGGSIKTGLFHESFIAAVEANHSLSDVQGLSYLKACMLGEAAQITNLPLSSGKYAVGSKIPKYGCSSKRLILHSRLDAILNITQSPRINGTTGETQSRLIKYASHGGIELQGLT